MRRPDHLFSFFTPRGAALSVAFHAACAARFPLVYFPMLFRVLRNRGAGLAAFARFPVDAAMVAASPLFDAAWYAASAGCGVRDAAVRYLLAPWRGTPGGGAASPRFSCAAYVAANPEIADCGVHPLVHYEQYGRFTGLALSPEAASERPPVFPPGAADEDFAAGNAADFPVRRRRVAFFAAFCPGGRVPDPDLSYLAALRETCDAVFFVANSPLLPGERARIEPFAERAVCRFHGGYDFGSWRIALEAARGAGWLSPERCDELVFANDSCLAPVSPFGPMFGEMAGRRCDFWGVTENAQFTAKPHLQSYFVVFRRPVLDSGALEDFFAARPERVSRAEAVRTYEMQLTDFLRGRGFVPDSFVRSRPSRLFPANPTARPLSLVRRFHVPMVKAKVFRGESADHPRRVLALLRRANPALAAMVRVELPR